MTICENLTSYPVKYKEALSSRCSFRGFTQGQAKQPVRFLFSKSVYNIKQTGRWCKTPVPFKKQNSHFFSFCFFCSSGSFLTQCFILKIQWFKDPNIWTSKDPKIQRSKDSNIQIFQDPNTQRSKDSKIQRFKYSKIQRFQDPNTQRAKDSKIQRFKYSKIQRFKDQKIQRSKDSMA